MNTVPAAHGLNRNQLKNIAVAAMILDHVGVFLIPGAGIFYLFCRTIGRLTAPVMCFFLAEGFHHTSSRKNYALRLLLFAIISQFLYAFLHGGLFHANLNVLFTLLISFFVLAVRHSTAPPAVKWTFTALLLVLSITGDWGAVAPLWVLCFDLFRSSRRRQLTAFALIAGADLLYILTTDLTSGSVWYLHLWEAGLFLFIPLILLYNGQRGSGGAFGKWFFYMIYPLHFVIIILIMHIPVLP